MTIKGGIDTSQNNVELSISISGGKSYKRVYNDVVSVAINKFNLISTTLSKLIIAKTTQSDVKFYIDQIKLLLQRSHVELIPGDLPFHDKYNIWLLDGYVRMLLETKDLKMITQLLNIDSILYSIEEVSLQQNQFEYIDFEIPKKIEIVKISEDKELATPVANELSAYIHSLNHNLLILNEFIVSNKEAFVEIHKNIISTASKYLN